MKLSSFLGWTAWLAFLGLFAPAEARSEPVMINGIAARVNDAIITFQQIEGEMDEPERLLHSQLRNQPEVLKQRITQLRNDTVELLIERLLILDDFNTNPNYKLPESIVEEVIRRRIRDKFGDRARMIKTLEQQGIKLETFRQRIKEDIIVNAMEFKNVGSGIVISPYKIQTHYELHLDDMKVEDEVKLRMIFLKNTTERAAQATKKKAEEILAKIKGGASFAEEASANSDDAYQAVGGLRPAEDRKTLREDLAKVAFSLKPGELSDVLELPEGCYLMKVEEFHPAHTRPLNEVRGEIEKALEAEQRQRLRKQWIERLKAKAFIRLFQAT
jgi:peptidyl-prolyl cis-trans isomerase SurA